MRRNPGVDDAGDPLRPEGRARLLRRRPARGRAEGRGTVLRPRPPARRPRAGAALPTGADRPRAEPEDRPRQGLRPDPTPRPGGGGLPRDGRAPGDQDAAPPVIRPAPCGRNESRGGPTMNTWPREE